MNSSYEIVEGPVKVEENGFALRIAHDEGRETYRVEYISLLDSGEIDGEWGVFGGSVGYGDSAYETLEAAQEFYQQAQMMAGDRILDHFAVGESS